MKYKNFFYGILLVFLVLFSAISAKPAAQPYVRKGFVIIQSSKKYSFALKTAERASKLLKVKINFRGLLPNKETGLSFTRDECEKGGGIEYPAYIPRGRYDDGEYISIEYSNGYQSFTKGYYIVIIASFKAGDKRLYQSMQRAKKYFKGAYIKTAKVYLGCIH